MYSYDTLKNGNTELFVVPALHLHLDPFHLNRTYQLANSIRTSPEVELKTGCRRYTTGKVHFLDNCVSVLKDYHSHFISSLKKVMRNWLKKTIQWSENWFFSESRRLNTSTVFHLPESKIKKRQRK